MVLGTRGSELARAQTALVETALRAAQPGIEIAIEIITTRGDEGRSGRKGLFTGEIERALVEGKIDVAVHSAKDLPSDATAGVEICAALPRAAVEDVLIARTAPDVASLPAGTTVATGSVRRQHQLRRLRPDLNLVDLRGNVPTRLRKLAENHWEGIILARAGLERLGFRAERGELRIEAQTFRLAILALEDFLPAGGQGIIALQIRSDDEQTRSLAERINHSETLCCLRAEREFLRLLEGDCDTPVGVLATIAAGVLRLRAHIFDEERMGSLDGAAASPEDVARNLWKQLNER